MTSVRHARIASSAGEGDFAVNLLIDAPSRPSSEPALERRFAVLLSDDESGRPKFSRDAILTDLPLLMQSSGLTLEHSETTAASCAPSRASRTRARARRAHAGDRRGRHREVDPRGAATGSKDESIAVSTFFGRVPYQLGDYAVKFRLVPVTVDGSIKGAKGDNQLLNDARERLKSGEITYVLEAQFNRKPSDMAERASTGTRPTCRWGRS